jgi:type IV pilus assembly protein PilB
MFKGVSDAELRAEAIKYGMTTLYCDGIRKVMNGITTLDEVYRTAKRTEQESLAMETVIQEYLQATPA